MTDTPDTPDSQDTETPKLPLDPIWRQAALDACDAFQYGDVIPHEWVIEHLAIHEPERLMSVAEHKQRSFEILQRVEGFKEVMLEDYQRYLSSVRGVGYKIIEPPYQTDAAMRKLQADLHKSLSKAMGVLVHINDTALSIEDAQKNAEAKAKLAWFNTVAAKRLQHKKDPE